MIDDSRTLIASSNELTINVQGSDVSERAIMAYDASIFKQLLSDKSSKRNIVWATKDYEALGPGYEEFTEILPEAITREQSSLIQPRISKSSIKQSLRTRGKAEVFTPCWICNEQNNLIEAQWFGRDNVFNTVSEQTWIVNADQIAFDIKGNTWQKYVDARRLEIACGEAPYLVSRYDTVSGKIIPLDSRIGLLDRKMRIINENTEMDEEWLFWSQRAVESIYGYEYQGDSLLLARENILFSYIDYFFARFQREPDKNLLRKIARIISWNIWQMDGLKYVIPGSCQSARNQSVNLMGEKITYSCAGCVDNDARKHMGIYCKVQDWRRKTSVRFVDIHKRR